MNTTDFTVSFAVSQPAQDVFNAVTNVRGWWSENIEGNTANQGDEFVYQAQDLHYCKIRLTEVVPNQRVVWLVTYNYFKFTKDKAEWMGDQIVFDITEKDGQTELTFTQHGLTPQAECYDICSKCWTEYVTESLRNLITVGKGQPNEAECNAV
ncbi:uncharacterized protein YndB with AHSA1/START domain [Mucilaginibacter yixingensis]|uniref:Uncharacterized protein YndB with AHSA1/START domain n=1 Tax=Mucilaginibacter yixingensis TaxID=1295612 RepID=A0A2T5JG91_9SPHI|nr:SRPBCC domain-containing protein [Mucilaginibacter yixingensis]PTR01386.1 uncharacterized protein YndB with AHSA1/START domain [Mucilaginibacter yixingensis]